MIAQEIRTLAAMTLLSLLPASMLNAEEARIPKPRPLSTSELAAQSRWSPAHSVALSPKTKVSWPKLVTGLAMIGAGTAMMAASPGKTGSKELQERAGGSIPCRVSTYVNGSLNGSRSTTCENVMGYSHSPAFNGGAGLVVTGGLFAVWGLAKKRPAR